MSVHRGEGVCLSACWDAIPPLGWRTPPDGDPPRWRTPPGDPGMEIPPGWRPPRWRTHPPREADSSIRSTSGRYASYWNAFLFLLLLDSIVCITICSTTIIILFTNRLCITIHKMFAIHNASLSNVSCDSLTETVGAISN